MDSHKNAPLTSEGRFRLVQAVEQGERIAQVARNFHVDRKTARKWIRRFNIQGLAGLEDRSRVGLRPRLQNLSRAGAAATALAAYNWHRPHASLGGQPPISRLQLRGDKLLRLHT